MDSHVRPQCDQRTDASEDAEAISRLFSDFVMPTYGRYDLTFLRGEGSWLWDSAGERYLDLCAGIAVCSLGHANPELNETLRRQASNLWHVSNLFYQRPQGLLAQAIVKRMGEGKVFFCNSGAEANEGLYKLARKFGSESGRYEILTAQNSFHGRTLAGISATGQEKVKVGFGPMVEGFRSVPFNDLLALQNAIGPKTVAILIEGIQGEGGIRPATAEYLLGLRKLCLERNLLLLMDSIQCGMYRSGCFQSYQRLLEGHPRADEFFPDGISMAKGLGGGFPIGAVWARSGLCDLLGPGTHAATFGGNLLATSVALRVFEIIERDKLEVNVRTVGELLKSELQRLRESYPALISDVRGLGLMIGVELRGDAPEFSKEKPKTPAAQFVSRLLQHKVLIIPAGENVIRFVPALTLTKEEALHGVEKVEQVLKNL